MNYNYWSANDEIIDAGVCVTSHPYRNSVGANVNVSPDSNSWAHWSCPCNSHLILHTIRVAVAWICHEQCWGRLRWPNAKALPEWKGRIGSISRCRWCAATVTFLLAVRVCSVCKGKRREIEGLVPIILRARPVRWVSLKPCTVYNAGLICYPNAGSH